MLTFIIPTIGRESLVKTVNGLINQTNPSWKAIIIFDGVKPLEFKDSRIRSISIDKTGKSNHAGQVRNIGIAEVDTDWVAFVDDDDTVSKDYVAKFEEEIKLNPDAKCVIFRMRANINGWKVLPDPKHDNFYMAQVGISFAMLKDLNKSFEPSGLEDFTLLQSIRGEGHKMVISPYVTYFVRSLPTVTEIYNRAVING